MILTYAFLLVGFVSFIGILIIYGMFGGLIKNQWLRWRLAKKGYVEIEHISETALRQYIVAKPSNKSFDFFDGFFHYDPEAVTRGDKNVLKSYDRKELEDALYLKEEEIEALPEKERLRIKEIRDIQKKLKRFKFDKEALTYRYGMPIITYYADKPDPILFRDLKRQYPSTFIKDMYLRLLLTQRYGDFKKFITYALIAGAVIAVALIAIMLYLRSLTNDLGLCQSMLNYTIGKYTDLVNVTTLIKSQASTIVVP